jgi:hypothetical protein
VEQIELRVRRPSKQVSGCRFNDSVGCGEGGRSRWRHQRLRQKPVCRSKVVRRRSLLAGLLRSSSSTPPPSTVAPLSLGMEGRRLKHPLPKVLAGQARSLVDLTSVRPHRSRCVDVDCGFPPSTVGENAGWSNSQAASPPRWNM